METPGKFVRVLAEWKNTLPKARGALHAWDLRWHRGIPSIGKGPLLIVTRHTGLNRKCNSRISFLCANTGQLLHEAFGSERRLKQANMLVLE